MNVRPDLGQGLLEGKTADSTTERTDRAGDEEARRRRRECSGQFGSGRD